MIDFIAHDYQEEAVDFIVPKPASALFLDCGLGKTPIVLTAINELVDTMQTKGVLVVAPLRVARLVWPLEIHKWSHTSWMRHTVLHGPKKAERLRGDFEIYTINYEGLVWLVGELKKIPVKDWPFDTVVWDELTKMKSHSSVRFKKVKTIIKKFKKRIGLTGTPVPKSLMDLYGQMFVLDGGERLGTAFGRFRDRFFEKDDYKGYKYILRPGAEKKIYELIGDIVLRMGSDEYLDLLKPEFIDIELNLPAKIMKQYLEFEKKMFVRLENESNDEIEVFNAAALTNKCLQFASGSLHTDGLGTWKTIHDIKLDALKKIVKKHKGEPILVAYTFVHEAKRIAEAFPDAKFMKSGLSEVEELKLQDDWNNGKISMLVCHPASAGHGLNLQYGGHIAFWFTLNWSLELYIQFNKRIDRQGQTETPLIYKAVVLDTVDEVVDTTLSMKDDTQNNVLNALRLYRESKVG